MGGDQHMWTSAVLVSGILFTNLFIASQPPQCCPSHASALAWHFIHVSGGWNLPIGKYVTSSLHHTEKLWHVTVVDGELTGLMYVHLNWL